MSNLIIEYLAKDSKLTEREVDMLQYNATKELYGQTLRLEADEEIYQIILDAYPEAFNTNLLYNSGFNLNPRYIIGIVFLSYS